MGALVGQTYLAFLLPEVLAAVAGQGFKSIFKPLVYPVRYGSRLVLEVQVVLRQRRVKALVLELLGALLLLVFLPPLMVAALAALEEVLMSALLAAAAAGRVVLVLLRPVGQTAR